MLRVHVDNNDEMPPPVVIASSCIAPHADDVSTRYVSRDTLYVHCARVSVQTLVEATLHGGRAMQEDAMTTGGAFHRYCQRAHVTRFNIGESDMPHTSASVCGVILNDGHYRMVETEHGAHS